MKFQSSQKVNMGNLVCSFHDTLLLLLLLLLLIKFDPTESDVSCSCQCLPCNAVCVCAAAAACSLLVALDRILKAPTALASET
jgi:hypothetical protein